MIRDRAGLRLRLAATVLAAALLPIAPLAIALLLQVRDAVYARRVADARARVAVAAAAARACGDGSCLARVAEAAGAKLTDEPCAQRAVRRGDEFSVCEALRPGASLELREDLAPVRAQLAALDARILVTLALFVGALVGLAVWLLERGVVRRLAQVDDALEAVGAEHEGPALLPEGGDAVGRVGAAVNRLAQRLRDERARTRAQIAELRAAREEVARAERLASVGRLATGVAHEVGNPVAALIGYAALMREGLAAGADVRIYAERVEREASRIDRILRDLLDLARPRETPLRALDARRCVEVARALIEPQPVWKEVRLRNELPELPRLLGDEHYVVQLLVNLFSNAARAGAREVRVSGEAADDAVHLRVADDGRGIPPEALPRLFEPFFTTAPAGEGTGLGLALCHATMERLGGAISARNGERGAIFELRFRRAA